jgi:nucleotide-binding universal stress UspA family protein
VLTALLAAGVARATDAELRLVHVVPVFRGRNEEWTLGPQDESPPELEPSVKALSSIGVEPIREMAMGRPERTLVRVAERDEVDLVVVGHRGIGGDGAAGQRERTRRPSRAVLGPRRPCPGETVADPA